MPPANATAEQLELFPATPPVVHAPAKSSKKQRHLQLGTRIVSYHLNNNCRRISLTINEYGLRVGAPRSTRISEIEDFIRQHGKWVTTRLDQYTSHTRRFLSIRHGTQIPLLGKPIQIEVKHGDDCALWLDDCLLLLASDNADLHALARRGLCQRAIDVFTQRASMYAGQIGRTLPQIKLSSANTRWGSYSQKTGIRLNWRLIHMPLNIIDYVIAHELAHIGEMNHSARFWQEVERIYPDWRDGYDALKEQAKSLPII